MHIIETKKENLNYNVGKASIGSLTLESGTILENVELAYEIAGPIDAPVILVCHALTGNQFTIGTDEYPGWWSGLIGFHKYVDTSQFRVVTFNVLGGCNGSTGPTSINPKTGKPYRGDFPTISIRDMVAAEKKALDVLGIDQLYAVLGGSLGGMQALEWGLLFPNQLEKIFVFASTPFLNDYGIAFNRIAIEAIENDPNWKEGNYERSTDVKGLEVARMVGMVTYRSSEMFSERFSRTRTNHVSNTQPLFEVEAYLKHQGRKLLTRFDANSYLTLLHAMNTHDIGRDRGGWEQALEQIQAELIALSYENDLIYTPAFMQNFSRKVKQHHYYSINTKYGHDGFLVEFSKWGHIVQKHLE